MYAIDDSSEAVLETWNNVCARRANLVGKETGTPGDEDPCSLSTDDLRIRNGAGIAGWAKRTNPSNQAHKTGPEAPLGTSVSVEQHLEEAIDIASNIGRDGRRTGSPASSLLIFPAAFCFYLFRASLRGVAADRPLADRQTFFPGDQVFVFWDQGPPAAHFMPRPVVVGLSHGL